MFDLSPVLKLYAKYRISQLNHYDRSTGGRHVQEVQLLRLLRRAAGTKFGKEHGFSTIRSVPEYQARVPLRRYENFWEDYWKAAFPRLDNITWPGLIPYFALSSGTTSGGTKYIPYTPEMTASNRKAGIDLLVHHFNNHPASKMLGGHNFIMSSSTALSEYSPGVMGGDLSGIAMMTMPSWARKRSFPPRELTSIKTWEERLEPYARASLNADVRSLSGVPSWMLIMFAKLAELVPGSEGRLSKIYPNLEMIVHGGMNFDPYREPFKQALEGSRAETREVYPASEGFIAIQDRGSGEGMRVVPDHNIFFEFVPLDELDAPNPRRHWLGNIEKDINYAVVLSTCTGLWSYIIGDTVRFIETRPPRLLFTGRTSYMLSAVGEHLIGEEIEKAVLQSCEAQGLHLAEYSVGTIYPKTKSELATHLYVVEFNGAQPSAAQQHELVKLIDQSLIKANEDYDAHRRKDFGLNPPQLLVAKPGSFIGWMKSRGKFGGQNKVPRVINKQEILESLVAFVRG